MRLLAMTCLALLCVCAVSFAQPVSSVTLIEDAKHYDGKEIEFEGEAVGDIIGKGPYVWVNLFDGQNALGIWIKKEGALAIQFKGDYNFKGDIIKVKGMFNRACKYHGGELDIHADTLEIIKSGEKVTHKINKAKLNIVSILVIAGLAIASARFFISRKAKK